MHVEITAAFCTVLNMRTGLAGRQRAGAWARRWPSNSAFSLAPAADHCQAVAGAVFGATQARAAVVTQFQELIGPVGAEAVERLLNATANLGTGVLATFVGIVLLLVGASSVVIELQNDLNRIWRVPKRDHSGYTRLIRTRLLAFGLILGFGFLLLVSLVVRRRPAALVQHSRMFAQQGVVLHALNMALSIGAYSVLFAMLFKFLPNVSCAGAMSGVVPA